MMGGGRGKEKGKIQRFLFRVKVTVFCIHLILLSFRCLSYPLKFSFYQYFLSTD